MTKYDLRFYNGKLQVRSGKAETVRNKAENKYNNLPKFIERVKWNKWKDVRDETQSDIKNSNETTQKEKTKL